MTEPTAPGFREPMFNVPASVVAMLAVFAGVFFLLNSGAAGDDWLTLALAFIPARYGAHGTELPGGEVAMATSFFTHMLVHADLTHLLVNSAWGLAFGGAIARRMGGWRFVLFAVTCGLSGAVLFLILNPGLLAPMVGASGAISGLMGGTMRFLYRAVDTGGGLRQLREAPQELPAMSLGEALRDRRVLGTTAVWLGINALAVLGLGAFGSHGGIAWEAHVGGYAAGLLLFGCFDKPLRRAATR